MRNLSLLVLLGLVGAACGGDGGKKHQDGGAGDGGMDGGGDGDGVTIPDGGGLKYPECPREEAPPWPSSDPSTHVWTEDDITACLDACNSLTDIAKLEECYAENCPGFDLFDECMRDETRACLTSSATGTSKAGGCRTEWENYLCCAVALCDDPSLSDQEYFDCLDTGCGKEIEATRKCFQAKQRGSFANPCPGVAQEICLSGNAPLGDGGTDDADAGADGGTKSKSRSTGITRVGRAQLRALRLNLFKLPRPELLKLKK